MTRASRVWFGMVLVLSFCCGLASAALYDAHCPDASAIVASTWLVATVIALAFWVGDL